MPCVDRPSAAGRPAAGAGRGAAANCAASAVLGVVGLAGRGAGRASVSAAAWVLVWTLVWTLVWLGAPGGALAGPASSAPAAEPAASQAGGRAGGQAVSQGVTPGAAEPGPAGPARTVPLTWDCLMDSAERFEVPPALLLAVLEVERGQVGAASRNADGSRDLGPMQINALWLPRLAGLGLDEDLVRDHGCLNVAVGAWLLRGHLRRTGDPAQAAADYHSRTPDRGRRYRRALLRRALRLQADRTLAWANGRPASPEAGQPGIGQTPKEPKESKELRALQGPQARPFGQRGPGGQGGRP
ncbi:MAG: lytic transglycosylase domain-containing protein [Deltaproteobacteria bacterium]|jgi:hypothetical protein|nr:lytic transglycosylase domain-containing protein [Deltaproteobacteria bacterium]